MVSQQIWSDVERSAVWDHMIQVKQTLHIMHLSMLSPTSQVEGLVKHYQGKLCQMLAPGWGFDYMYAIIAIYTVSLYLFRTGESNRVVTMIARLCIMDYYSIISYAYTEPRSYS